MVEKPRDTVVKFPVRIKIYIGIAQFSLQEHGFLVFSGVDVLMQGNRKATAPCTKCRLYLQSAKLVTVYLHVLS